MRAKWILSLSFCLAVVACDFFLEIANSKSHIVLAETTPRPGFKLYQQAGLYSIEYPSGWVVNTSNSGPGGIPYLVIWSRKPPSRGGGVFPAGFVKTDIFVEPISFERSRQQLLQPQRRGAEPGRLVKRKKLVINGQEAFTTWWAGGEDTAGYIVTLVRHRNGGTVKILSFHGEINSAMSKTIEDLHNSLKVLD